MMNNLVNNNFEKVKFSSFYVPLFFLVVLAVFFSINHAWTVDDYIAVQKEAFFRVNSVLSHYPKWMENLTQLGDALIMLSFLSSLLIFTPRISGPLLLGSLISGLLCCSLKWLFNVPRPAAVLDTKHFVVIGKKLVGSNSLPSGHAITVLTTLTIVLIAFMPQKKIKKLAWILGLITISAIICLTRVGVGAHYTLDVTIGAIIGYIAAVGGIIINQKWNLWRWISKKQYIALLTVVFLVCCGILFQKIVEQQLPVFFGSFICLCISLYITICRFKDPQRNRIG